MKLKDARTTRNLTQKELADKAGMSQSMIARIETGERNYSLGSMRKLAQALGVSAEKLLTDA